MGVELHGFINSDRLTKIVKYFLVAQIVIAFVTILSTYLEYQLLVDLQTGFYDSDELAAMDAEASDSRQSLMGVIYLINFIASGIAILMWIYRANYNSHELGAKHLHFTPGWSIGFYFIPIVTLWKPYEAMKEIWQASEHPKNWKSVHVSGILPLWWTLWLINNVLGNVLFKSAKDAKGLDALKDANILQQISSVLDIALAIVFFFIVTRIHKNQTNAYVASMVPEELELPEEKEVLDTLEIHSQ